jgi:hypothetical protein
MRGVIVSLALFAVPALAQDPFRAPPAALLS